MSRKGARIARGRAGRTDGAVIVGGRPGESFVTVSIDPNTYNKILSYGVKGETLKRALPSRANALKAIREDQKRVRRQHRSYDTTRDEIDIDAVLSGG